MRHDVLHLLEVGADNKVLITGGAVKIFHQHQLLCDSPELSWTITTMLFSITVKECFLCAI